MELGVEVVTGNDGILDVIRLNDPGDTISRDLEHRSAASSNTNGTPNSSIRYLTGSATVVGMTLEREE